MDEKRIKIISALTEVLKSEINHVLLVSKSPDDTIIHNIPRIIIILEGNKEIHFYEGNEIKKAVFEKGSAFYCTDSGYMYSADLAPSVCLSLCFYGDYIRSMVIDYDGMNSPPTARDVFYHTDRGLSNTGRFILNALDETAKDPVYKDVAPELLKALMRTCIEDISASGKGKKVKPSMNLWLEMEQYIRSNLTESISRKSVASHFRLTPGYVSHLFKKFKGRDFVTVLTEYRIEYAVQLLKQTRLSVDEIAGKCNFKYTSYFIRRFRKYYNMTPADFRNCHDKNK